jgi:RNA polymerase sigma factor (sigma-70 family)
VEPWALKLDAGDAQAGWDLFVERYRRLIFAAIRHYTADHDEVMDVFAQVCEALRADDLAGLRGWLAQPSHTARFSTWLVAVVRNLTVDWFRHRDGRARLSTVAAGLPPLQRRIFEYVFVRGQSHIETYELIRSADHADLTFTAYLEALRATYRTVAARRKRGLMSELGGPPPEEPAAAGDDPAVRAEQGVALADALSTLAPEDRLVVQLFVIEDLPAEQVARIVGLPNAKAVYNRAYRALADLRRCLERAGISGADL